MKQILEFCLKENVTLTIKVDVPKQTLELRMIHLESRTAIQTDIANINEIPEDEIYIAFGKMMGNFLKHRYPKPKEFTDGELFPQEETGKPTPGKMVDEAHDSDEN